MIGRMHRCSCSHTRERHLDDGHGACAADGCGCERFERTQGPVVVERGQRMPGRLPRLPNDQGRRW